MERIRVHITGVVQGVGFRPFVFGLADRQGLTGWVRNTSAGVDIEADGEREKLEAFARALRDEAPPLARIDSLDAAFLPPAGFRQFEIVHSEAVDGAFQPISPDVAICADCLRELFDPSDRRYLYPFINCTNCGPRFTIIQDIPYDRPKTTMAPFAMCPDCAREYADPRDRRFHAQPVACVACGPKIWLEVPTVDGGPKTGEILRSTVNGQPSADSRQVVLAAQSMLAGGKLLAIKGLGGFHLACDATDPAAVAELRRRKLRVDKPFALMMPDIATIEQHCFISAAERELLESPARPIVLLKRRPGSDIAPEVAPGQDTVGVMLPYTPLHYLLLTELSTVDRGPQTATTVHRPLSPVLVMTSGNLSEEPIATGNDEARERLAPLADAFLMHDRDIHVRCDDSVVRVISDQLPVVSDQSPESLITDHRSLITYPLRRSRGYAPFPVKLTREVPSVLAVGPELKNTFCLTNGSYAFLSHHIGDMQNYETLRSFEQGVEHFERLFRVKPVAIAHDLHPDYLSTRYAVSRAERESLPTFSVQHHHAHIAACMAEHGLDGSRPVIGLACDGTGYGADGAIWGGEVLLADFAGYERPFHLAYFPLPGGDAAIRRPARTALALLWSIGLGWEENLAPVRDFCEADRTTLQIQLGKKLNTPLTSSMGRLFDAAAALAGVRQAVNYEGQAAIEFEALADPDEAEAYPFGLDQAQIVVREAFEALVADALAGVPVPKISARFHNGLSDILRVATLEVSRVTGIREVALSGGVWQNVTLLGRTLSALQAAGFTVYIHHEVPTNDGGISLGQAVVAAHQLQ
jgi:hydrogenase maturation protein HypF